MSERPQTWTSVTVEDLAAAKPGSLTDGPFGSNLKTSHYTDQGPRVIRLQNIGDGTFLDERAHISPSHFGRLRKHEAIAGDVVVALLGEILPRACVVPKTLGQAIVKADCARLRVENALSSGAYVANALNSHQLRTQARERVHGVGRPRLGLRWLRTLEIPLAPVREQERIVSAIESIFTRLDDVTATLERVERNLKRYRASVLKAAVEGRLVPTEAELARAEGRSYEPASVLMERILAERHRNWEESELAKLKASGRVPTDDRWKEKYYDPDALAVSDLPELAEGWSWTSLGQIGDVTGGLTQNVKREQLPMRLPFLRVANVYANELRLDDVRAIGVTEGEVERARLQSGDLLVVEGNGSIEQIGRVAVWDGSIEPCLHQNHIIKARFVPVLLANWVLAWLLSPLGRRAIERAASSTSGLHTLSLSKVARLPVPLPPLAEQTRITAEVDRLLTLAVAAGQQVTANCVRLSRVRQSILKWAFEGRLVDQDPTDEPASVLLERIRAERTAATGTGSRKDARMKGRSRQSIPRDAAK